MTERETWTGRCLCGAVRYAFDPKEIRWSAHCVCESCRRATASPITSFMGLPEVSVTWSGQVPGRYESSARVFRDFCATCGTQMSFRSHRWPDEVHLYAATLDQPSSYCPRAIVHADEKLPWFDVAGDLPRE